MPAHPKPSAKPKKPSGLNRANAAAKATRSKPKSTTKLTNGSKIVTTDDGDRLKSADAPKAAKPKKAAPAKPAAPSGTSKTELLLGMLTKPGGASSREMEAATGWAPHSVRGFLGTLRKKGVPVLSKKFGKGEPTVYSIEASHEIPPPPPQPDAPPVEDPGEVV